MKKQVGYKVFSPDFSCGNYQFEVGKTYTYKGKIDLCEAGFHFCQNLKDCFSYCSFDTEKKVAQVVALGETICGKTKSVTNKIKITKELSWNEVLELVNAGTDNSGFCNSGNWNSAHWNSGDWNSGSRNSGSCNSGSCNSGFYNSGFCNSGEMNLGNCNSGDKNLGNSNSGDRNLGSRNSGMFNACDHANGLFNSKPPTISMFNKPTEMTFEEFQEKYKEAYNLLYYSTFNLIQWVSDYKMTDEEKVAHPEYKTTGGYLKSRDFKEACNEMWEDFTEIERNKIKKLPNFDKDIFFEITGIVV